MTRGRDILMLILGPVIIIVLIAASVSADLSMPEILVMSGFGLLLAGGWVGVLGRMCGGLPPLVVATIAGIGLVVMGAGCIWLGFAGFQGLEPRYSGTERLLPLLGAALAALGIGFWGWTLATVRRRRQPGIGKGSRNGGKPKRKNG